MSKPSGALTATADPAIAIDGGGGLPVSAASVSGIPVTGWRSRLTLAVMPPESVTLTVTRRCEGYSWSGATNVPLLTPDSSWITWAWHEPGQWSISKVQWNADAASEPS